VTCQLNEWRTEEWSDTLESLESEDQSLWKHDKQGDASSDSFVPLQVPGGLALSDSEKAEALADSLEVQVQPVKDTSDPAVIEILNEAKRAYEYATANEPKSTSPSEVQQAIRGLKFGKTSGPNGKPNRILRHLPKRAISYLTKVLTQSCAGSTSHQFRNTLAWCPYRSRERTPHYVLPIDPKVY
jgi:hypothetical protein